MSHVFSHDSFISETWLILSTKERQVWMSNATWLMWEVCDMTHFRYEWVMSFHMTHSYLTQDSFVSTKGRQIWMRNATWLSWELCDMTHSWSISYEGVLDMNESRDMTHMRQCKHLHAESPVPARTHMTHESFMSEWVMCDMSHVRPDSFVFVDASVLSF